MEDGSGIESGGCVEGYGKIGNKKTLFCESAIRVAKVWGLCAIFQARLPLKSTKREIDLLPRSGLRVNKSREERIFMLFRFTEGK